MSFPEGERMVELLACARGQDSDFDSAWAHALLTIRRGRSSDNERWVLARDALRFAKPAFRRAYLGEPKVRQDEIAELLALVMAGMYDDSTEAEAEWVCLPEAA